MDRLLVVTAADRRPDFWTTHCVALAASAGSAAEVLCRLGPVLCEWPCWIEQVPVPPFGMWVWEGMLHSARGGQLLLHTERWRAPTVYEVQALVEGHNPWRAQPAPVLVATGDGSAHGRGEPPVLVAVAGTRRGTLERRRLDAPFVLATTAGPHVGSVSVHVGNVSMGPDDRRPA